MLSHDATWESYVTAHIFGWTAKENEIQVRPADYGKKYNADLIMIMTKKEELTLSNNISVTARYIINNADVPVMSIRPTKSKFITAPTTSFWWVFLKN